MKNGIILPFIFLFFGLSNSFAQNSYYFKKWKGKEVILADEVFILFDSTLTSSGFLFLEEFSKSVSHKISAKGITTHFGSKLIDLGPKALVIKLEIGVAAYVQLNFPQPNGFPLCNRLHVTQLNQLNTKYRNRVNTIISISVDKESEGLEQASEDFATSVFSSLVK